MAYNVSELKSALDLCFVRKKDNYRSSSVAYSKSGKRYAAGRIISEGKSVDISSEQAALVLSVQNRDFKVNKIVTLTENSDRASVSPAVLKTIADHAARTGASIEYTFIDGEGKVIFYSDNVGNFVSFYKPNLRQLAKTKEDNIIGENKIVLDNRASAKEEILKKYAILGLERNFPTYNLASGYGAAVLTKNNTLYFSGQYSDPENNTSVHSEVAAVISTLMNRDFEIIRLGLVSTKHLDKPCGLCGRCRQFISEINSSLNLDMEIFCFAKDTQECQRHIIKDYLPNQWSSAL